MKTTRRGFLKGSFAVTLAGLARGIVPWVDRSSVIPTVVQEQPVEITTGLGRGSPRILDNLGGSFGVPIGIHGRLYVVDIDGLTLEACSFDLNVTHDGVESIGSMPPWQPAGVCELRVRAVVDPETAFEMVNRSTRTRKVECVMRPTGDSQTGPSYMFLGEQHDLSIEGSRQSDLMLVDLGIYGKADDLTVLDGL